jgi:hypothetical protein
VQSGNSLNITLRVDRVDGRLRARRELATTKVRRN